MSERLGRHVPVLSRACANTSFLFRDIHPPKSNLVEEPDLSSFSFLSKIVRVYYPPYASLSSDSTTNCLTQECRLSPKKTSRSKFSIKKRAAHVDPWPFFRTQVAFKKVIEKRDRYNPGISKLLRIWMVLARKINDRIQKSRFLLLTRSHYS